MLLGLLVLGIGRGLDRTNETTAAPTGPDKDLTLAQRSAPATDPKLLVIGDSFAGGVDDPTITRNYPAILADSLGMTLELDAMGARGFLPNLVTQTDPPTVIPPFIDHLAIDAREFKPDYIVIDGGRNDLSKDPAAVSAALSRYYADLRRVFPQAKIVAVVPSYVVTERADSYPAIAATVRSSSEQIGAYVLDPVAEGWYDGVNLAPLLWRDGVHLNAAGAQFYADKIANGMRRLGVVAISNPSQ